MQFNSKRLYNNIIRQTENFELVLFIQPIGFSHLHIQKISSYSQPVSWLSFEINFSHRIQVQKNSADCTVEKNPGSLSTRDISALCILPKQTERLRKPKIAFFETFSVKLLSLNYFAEFVGYIARVLSRHVACFLKESLCPFAKEWSHCNLWSFFATRSWLLIVWTSLATQQLIPPDQRIYRNTCFG